MIRCKFKCESMNLREEVADVQLSAVTTGSKENAQFFKYTPSGVLNLQVVDKETAAANFEPGKEYYIDISPAETR